MARRPKVIGRLPRTPERLAYEDHVEICRQCKSLSDPCPRGEELLARASQPVKVYGAKSASDHHVDCCFRCRRGTPCKEGIRLRGIADLQEISRKTAAG